MLHGLDETSKTFTSTSLITHGQSKHGNILQSLLLELKLVKILFLPSTIKLWNEVPQPIAN